MHILIIPSWYPSRLTPVKGDFIKQQVEAVKGEGVQLGVILPELASLRLFNFPNLKKNHFQYSETSENGINVFRINGWAIPHSKKINFYLFKFLARKLYKKYIDMHGVPDIIHAHCFMQAGIVAATLGRRDIPVVVTEHSSAYRRKLFTPWQKKLIVEMANRVKTVISVSAFLKDSIEDLGVKNKVSIVPNVVDTDFFCAKELVKNEGYRFLTIALLTKNKGVDILLKAFAKSFVGVKGVYLDIGGDGLEKLTLMQLARELHIEKQVNFLGMLDKKGVRNALWNADAFVLPSFVETFGVVLIEAMATGLPVISTKSGGPNEFIPIELGCSLVDKGDVNKLSEALNVFKDRGLTSKAERENLSQYVVESFGRDSLRKKLINIYQKALSG